MVPKTKVLRETRFRTRAEAQDEVRRRAHELALRKHVLNKMEALRKIRDGDVVDDADFSQCLSAGTLTDVGFDEDGAFVTVLGPGIDVPELLVFAYVPYYATFMFVENFVMGRT